MEAGDTVPFSKQTATGRGAKAARALNATAHRVAANRAAALAARNTSSGDIQARRVLAVLLTYSSATQ